MMKRKKLVQRSWNYGGEFFAFQGKKASVPSGCVFAGICCVAALAGMNHYLTRAASRRLPRENSNAMHIKYENTA